MIPQSYEQWQHCVTVQCGIALTSDYIGARLRVWRDEDAEETRRFRRLYGDAHWRSVCAWFARAGQNVSMSDSRVLG